MNKINDTISLCEHCYRHLLAVKFEKDGQIWLSKECPVHGYSEYLVDPNAEFYLNYNYPKRDYSTYFIEATNRCNLNCPHCYQIPDNKSKDYPIPYFTNLINSWQDDNYVVCLAGAEPTVRNDLDLLVNEISKSSRQIIILTNGVKLSDFEYAEKFKDLDNLFWTIGLNHPDYQGKKVRSKQMKGIQNCIDLGLKIKNISYTLEGFHQLEFCLDEIHDFYPKFCDKFRIRVGSDIGRVPNEETIYLSQLVKETENISRSKGWSFNTDSSLGIRAHYPVYINDIYVKLIQWPDVRTIDMEEKQTETWAELLPDYPITPLIHQAIIRDAVVNKGIVLQDEVPKKYTRPKKGNKKWKLAKYPG